ncbi:hypothetical protein PMAA_050810 [Talaromyces marneffei ATCC 18224]|uniref:Carboxylesterase type B domain-containing protein n=1 Tax=Talaromyces marneffei (strain ATCC 18224 / CBS 334.59 / QM 7333) TaxID=441960 RepID=B6QML0_TALMQ|nr:hypothetical protein PMAA_050810 [Talaromyces marneffei ATCC 18224]
MHRANLKRDGQHRFPLRSDSTRCNQRIRMTISESIEFVIPTTRTPTSVTWASMSSHFDSSGHTVSHGCQLGATMDDWDSFIVIEGVTFTTRLLGIRLSVVGQMLLVGTILHSKKALMRRIRSSDIVAISNVFTTSNSALYDQRAGLDWVKRNIDHFGCDAKRITVMGDRPAIKNPGVLGTMTWTPAVDGVYVPKPAGLMLKQALFDHSVKIMTGHNSNEGTEAAYLAYLQQLIPDATNSTIDHVITVLYARVFKGGQQYLTEGAQDIYLMSLRDGGHISSTYEVNVTLAKQMQRLFTKFTKTGSLDGDSVPTQPIHGKNSILRSIHSSAPVSDDEATQQCDW